MCVPQIAQAWDWHQDPGSWVMGSGNGTEKEEKSGSCYSKISEAGQHRVAWTGEVCSPMQVTSGTL